MPGALAGATKLAGIEEVEIDSTGRFKYILCKVYEQGGNPATGAVKHVVRGTSRAEFHCKLWLCYISVMRYRGTIIWHLWHSIL